MQVTIAEQSVHRLDVVLDEGSAPTVTFQTCQCEPATAEQRVDDPHQGMLPGLVTNDGVAPQPLFQQSHRVHAVPSESSAGK